MNATAEVVVGSSASAVADARRLVESTFPEADASVVEDLRLIVTELLTNALLHGEPPVVLRLRVEPAHALVEVEDHGRELPVSVRRSGDAMTGRGLALVTALSSGWGVVPAQAGGKRMWARVPLQPGDTLELAPTDFDLDALLASWPDDDADRRELFTIRLGSVPTGLLLAAKAHIDNVVRELTLIQTGGTSAGEQLTPGTSQLIETVTQDFAEARAAIKRQAVGAAARGEMTTDLVLNLPLSSADAGERYLTALEEVDRYAHSARLLTLAPPASHQAFRRWYVQSLVDQLRAAARGLAQPVPEPFPQVLAAEVDRLSLLKESSDRLQLLQRVTTELTNALTVTDVAVTVVNQVAAFPGVETARVFQLTDRATLRSLAFHGDNQAGQDPYEEFPLDADLPGSVAARTGEPLFYRGRAQIYQRFPRLTGYYPTERSLHVAPLRVGEHTLGVLTLAFVAGEVTDDAQQAFVKAVAGALAQAMERALAIESARGAMRAATQANTRLSFLATASVALSSSLDFSATLDTVSSLLVPQFADWCVLTMLNSAGDGRQPTVAVYHGDLDKATAAQSLAAAGSRDLEPLTGAGSIMASGQGMLRSHVTAQSLGAAPGNPELLALLAELGVCSTLSLPLVAGSEAFGALTLVYADSGRQYGEEDVSFLHDVAQRAALALGAADRFRQQTGRLASVSQVADAAQRAILSQVADAAQRAILSPPPPRLGTVNLAARYVSAAADALVGGDLYEVVQRPGAVRLLVGDVRGKGLTSVRTATVVLGEFRAAASDVDDLAEVGRLIDRRLRPYLGEEDFVTAVLAEISDDGRFVIASCGHPPALLASKGEITELDTVASLPLGLGADPVLRTGQLTPGDRILLCTDGILEARDPQRRFLEIMGLVQPLVHAAVDRVLDEVLARLRSSTGPELGDDLALLLAEYRP